MQSANWFDLLAGEDRSDLDKNVRVKTQFDIEFGLWRDMVENPAMYGDSIVEWLELNETLTKGSGRWRLGAYWLKVADEEEQKTDEEQEAWRAIYSTVAKKAALEGMRRWFQRDIAAMKKRIHTATVGLQAVVRGHQARVRQPFRDCCMCLSHRISPLKADVGYMCRGCAEQGPYTEETGPLADPWAEFRADYA